MFNDYVMSVLAWLTMTISMIMDNKLVLCRIVSDHVVTCRVVSYCNISYHIISYQLGTNTLPTFLFFIFSRSQIEYHNTQKRL